MCVFQGKKKKKKKSFTLFSLMLFSVHFWCITCQKNALITCQTTKYTHSWCVFLQSLLTLHWKITRVYSSRSDLHLSFLRNAYWSKWGVKKSTMCPIMGQFSGVFCCIYRCIKHFTHHNTCVWTQPEALLTWYSFTFLKLKPERNLNRKVQGKACSFLLNLISVLN